MMIRKDGETVKEFLKRGDDRDMKQEEKKQKETIVFRERITADRIEGLRKMFPHARIVTEGAVVKCPNCGKFSRFWTAQQAEHRKLLCESCRDINQTKENYPGKEINEAGEVLLSCQQCKKEYWYDPNNWKSRYTDTMKLGPGKTFCSGYCKYCSTLKRPPAWNREEWDEIQEHKKDKKSDDRWGGWSGFHFGNSTSAEKEFDFGDPQLDANQESLFDGMVEYFADFSDPNRRLNAIHNVVKKLRGEANGCQVEIHEDDPDDPDEILQIE